MHPDLAKLANSSWAGTGELWLDPLGNQAQQYECTLAVDDAGVRYSWHHDGKQHEGRIALAADAPVWSDSWHQPTPMPCSQRPAAWGLLALQYDYAAGEGPPWRWRILLTQRPSGELVLQMTNIAPWGEEARAVRMVVARA
jgi:hypothetical protein